ncbi:hypothetical protein J6590_077765 [Homalodisca vitripennis]|nr:hypothetical protein J6590_077765 [Homalodisca vitripennis]
MCAFMSVAYRDEAEPEATRNKPSVQEDAVGEENAGGEDLMNVCAEEEDNNDFICEKPHTSHATDFWASSTSFQEAVSVSDSKGPNHEEQESESRKQGFTNWKKLSDKLPEHENSQYHKKTFVSWKALETSLGKGGIDKELQDQIKRRNPTGEKYYAVY